jgi:hypothetical protein
VSIYRPVYTCSNVGAIFLWLPYTWSTMSSSWGWQCYMFLRGKKTFRLKVYGATWKLNDTKFELLCNLSLHLLHRVRIMCVWGSLQPARRERIVAQKRRSQRCRWGDDLLLLLFYIRLYASGHRTNYLTDGYVTAPGKFLRASACLPAKAKPPFHPTHARRHEKNHPTFSF